MLRSLYIAATGMLTERKKMDVLTNNVANADTTGYKEDRLLSRSFKDMMIEKTGDPAILNITNVIGSQNTGVHVDEVYTNFTQGDMEETDIASNVALQGPGYFVVSTSAGDRYTRDGNFTVSSNGYLVNSDGNYVQGTNGLIQVGTGKFAIDSQGAVSVNGKVVNKLKIVGFADESGLRKVGNNLYINYTNQATTTPVGTTVKQGYLESSNVDITTQMANMLQISRSYETDQRMVKMVDETLDKTVNEVGKVY